MRLWYEGVDITDSVQVAGCVVRDRSCGRADSASLELEQAQNWYAWGPKQGDRIEITEDGYRSGEMYLAAVSPEGKKFNITATAAKPDAMCKAYKSYEGFRLGDLMRHAAGESGMDYRVYGLDETIFYPYLLRKNEGCCAFLDRLAKLEGAALKCWNGRFTMISIAQAQKLEAMETMELSASQPGMLYRRRESEKLKTLVVSGALAAAYAIDTGAKYSAMTENRNLPAADFATAGRWARGLLLSRNRQAESLELETKLHTLWTAMCRVDVTGETDAAGKWLCDEVEHDFIKKTSRGKFLRCCEGIK